MVDFSPPNQFSNVAHKWVHEHKRDSVLFVKMVRRPQCHQQITNYLIQNFNKTPAEAADIISGPLYATGFLAHRVGDQGFVLTCCHLLADLYSEETVLTESANWFKFLVLCKHNEDYMEANFPGLYDAEQDPRNYTNASIVRLDQSKDLLLLQVDMTRLYGDILPNQCPHPHPPLQFALRQPVPVTDVVMISWPPHLCDTVVIGQVVSIRGSYGQVTADRSKGYDMELMELKISGKSGTSGSPILDHRGDVVSLYHGRIIGKGYGVSLVEIMNFLIGN
ncbi:unnamed protein product [Urochloa humidicola]